MGKHYTDLEPDNVLWRIRMLLSILCQLSRQLECSEEIMRKSWKKDKEDCKATIFLNIRILEFYSKSNIYSNIPVLTQGIAPNLLMSWYSFWGVTPWCWLNSLIHAGPRVNTCSMSLTPPSRVVLHFWTRCKNCIGTVAPSEAKIQTG